MVNRQDRYIVYTDKTFEYKYPFSWADRSFNYLVTTATRDWDETQDYMYPCKTCPNSDSGVSCVMDTTQITC